jgi:Na+/proline symporter
MGNTYPAAPSSDRHVVHAATLWAGGAATAVVAALIALVGLLVVREIFDTPVVYPPDDGPLGSQTTALMVYAAVAALLATALAHVLMLTTPRAMSFFGWIMGLVTVIVTLAPFVMADASRASKIGSSIIYLVIGVAITSLISGVARTARRRAATERRGGA